MIDSDPFSPPQNEPPPEPSATMTGAQYGQGFINALICGVVVLAIWFLASWVIVSVTGWPAATAGSTAFGLLWGGTMLTFFSLWLHSLLNRGVRLLDCGPHPMRRLFLLNAGLFCVSGTLQAFSNGGWYAVLALVFTPYWIVMASGRLSLHESGIWAFWGLIPWDSIDRCEWSDQRTLRFRRKGKIYGLLRGMLPVPEECVDDFQRLLAEHLNRGCAESDPALAFPDTTRDS